MPDPQPPCVHATLHTRIRVHAHTTSEPIMPHMSCSGPPMGLLAGPALPEAADTELLRLASCSLSWIRPILRKLRALTICTKRMLASVLGESGSALPHAAACTARPWGARAAARNNLLQRRVGQALFWAHLFIRKRNTPATNQ